MGKRGPRPAPTSLKVLRGEQHLKRLNFDEPMPREGRPAKPATLSEAAGPVWDFYLSELDHMRLLKPLDGDGLAVLCEHVVVFRQAADLVARTGILVRSEAGTPMRNPALIAMRDAGQVIRAWAQEFGLTPSARSTIRAGDSDDDDPRERLLS